MKRALTFVMAVALVTAGCAPAGEGGSGGSSDGIPAQGGMATINDAGSAPTIAKIAADSPDHTTLVAALAAVNWIDALANPGPFTVFAPTNAAFEALPAGTVENLLKPENLGQLRSILLHHVMVSVYEPSAIRDGMSLAMLEGGPTTASKSGDQITIDGANVIASVRAGNGIVHVIDKVLLPK